MNKAILKSYFNGNKGKYKDILFGKCFEESGKYIISDSYSIIVLNDTYGLEVTKDNIGITRVKENLERDYNYAFKDYTMENFNEYLSKEIDNKILTIKDNYGINVPLFNKIQKIIKANTYTILENEQLYEKYVIKLENSKTKEYALLICSIII